MPSQTAIYSKIYNKFAGVDFSSDPSKVSDNRSPSAKNILSDAGGYPEKRVGWRRITKVIDSEADITHSIDFTHESEEFELIAPEGTSSSGWITESYGTEADPSAVTFLAMSISERSQAWGIKIGCPETGAGTYIASVTGFDDAGAAGMNCAIYLDDTYVGNFNFSAGNGENGYADVVSVNFFNEFELSGEHTLWFKCANEAGVEPAAGYKNRVNLISITLIRTDEHELPINSIGYFADGGCYIVHAGSNIYKWQGGDDLPCRLYSGATDARSKMLVMQGKMLILTGGELLIYDGDTVQDSSQGATVPYIISGRGAGTISGDYIPSAGNTYQPINMLTNQVKIGFTVPEGGADVLDVEGLGLTSVTSVSYVEKDGTLTEIAGMSVEASDGYVTQITTDSPLPTSSPIGTDTVFVVGERGEISDKIAKCTVMGAYENRVFFGGNPEYPNTDWHSQLRDPTYVSDLSYVNVGAVEQEDVSNTEQIGMDEVAIAGYARFGDSQLVLKRSHGQESAVFLRTTQLTDTERIFPISQSVVGEGVVAPESIAVLHDDPLFLTERGVCAISSRDMTSEKIMQMRSTRINARLCKEKNLEDAVAAVWNGCYLLFINGNVYVADSRQKSYLFDNSEDFEYEWYFWDNIPAKVVCSNGDDLYFADDEGWIYRFNTDMVSPRGGYLMEAYNDGGAPIVAEWSTKFDDDGDFNLLKILRRRGSGVHIKSYDRGDLEILVRTDHDFGELINERQHGIMSFDDLDFNHFTFNTYPHGFIPFERKVKDYRLIQVICRNSQLNQGFGVYAIERRFVRGYNAK